MPPCINMKIHKRYIFLIIPVLVLVIIFTGIVAIFSSLLLPWVYIGVGGYATLGMHQMQPDPPVPINTHGEFPFRFIYEINGEQYTIDDVIICDYEKIGVNLPDGKHIIWKERLASGTKLNHNQGFGIELFSGVMEGGSTTIICDIGISQYYLGYYKYTDYSPGYIKISSPSFSGIISAVELQNKYNVKIIEQEYSQPMVGNGIAAPK